ncbi:MAG: protease pro-enzyme activation domain-containing protein [Nevskia sp.]|nr:protease pro-enzyme activation domain-containing protein [Nevskia sp.]
MRSWKLGTQGQLRLAAAGLISGMTCTGAALAQPVFGDTVVRTATEQEQVRFVLTLPLRDQAGLNDLMRHLYTPGDPAYRRFLSSDEFDARFAPTREQYEALKSLATQYGLNVVGEHSGRTILDVQAPASTVRNVFGAQMNLMQQADGRRYFAPDREPEAPFVLSALGAEVAGINDKPRRAHLVVRGAASLAEVAAAAQPHAGTGPSGSYGPADIRTAYNLNGIQNGGEPVGLFELSIANYADAGTYASHFGLTNPTLTLMTVDGGTTDKSGSTEVMLDIEMVMAVSNPTGIVVYTGPNTNSGVLDTYTQIAEDNIVKQVSTSWGECEANEGLTNAQAENTAFTKMAMEGIAVFAASGDSGAYDCGGQTLGVDDPASQPYVTGVGGTTLTTTSTQGYTSEVVWDTSSTEGGGGGISRFWSIPSYQQGVVSNAPTGQYSTTMRNVPDVALDADPNTGFYVYDSHARGWLIVGGTSDAAPQYAAFWSLIGKGLGNAGHTPAAGFANPTLYSLAGNPTSYASDFHDVTSGTNNHYSAVTGYDDATGWGSYNGGNLYQAVLSTVGGGSSSSSSSGGSSSSGSSGGGSSSSSSGGSSSGSSGGSSSGSSGGSSSGSSGGSSSGSSGGSSSGSSGGSSSGSSGGSSSGSSGGSSGGGTPPAPTGLTASGTSYRGQGAEVLSWHASSGATRYYVYMGTSPGGESSTALGYVTGTSAEVIGLNPFTRYYFKVKAYDASGLSPYSNEASAVSGW